MKNQIPEFLQSKLKKSFALTERFPNEIKVFMIAYAIFYEWNITDNLQLTFRLMKQNISNLGTCEYKDCTKNKYLTKTGVSIGCSKKHTSMISNLKNKGVEWSSQMDETKSKLKETNIKKFGVDNPMKLDTTIQKGKDTKKERYGTENYNNLRKMQSTCVERYGDYNPMRIQEFKDKSKRTCLSKYGVTNNLKCGSTLEKIKHTNLLKYGVENCFSNFEIREKSKKTMVEKYGVEYPIQNANIYEKMVKTSFKYKEYKWVTGEISLLQGYEYLVLKELEDKGYGFNDILTDTIDMPEIWYEFENTKHRYFPDFFIPSENVIIEVKSEWTLKLHWDKNQAKFEATKALGFDFRLEVR